MVADGVDLLWTVAPDVFVLATSDKDMIPLARIAKQRGAAVVVLGSDLTAIPLVEMSNVFITYRQLLRELDRVSELEAPVGRAPARERRLRESRRPSSEPYGGGLGSGGSLGSGSSAIGATPLGVGGRSGPRSGGTMSASGGAVAPFPSPSAPRRRLQEPVAPPPVPVAEPERALVAPAAPAATDENADDSVGIGGSDLGPRRRRRRGGRGRRTGLGAVGDADFQAEALQEPEEGGSDADASDDEQGAASAAGTSPDDIDNAVLQLLAARDRDEPSTGTGPSEPAVSSPAAAESAPAFSAPSLTTSPSAPPASAARPRVARTSFSSFEPPELPFRRRAAEATPSERASGESGQPDRQLDVAASPVAESSAEEPTVGAAVANVTSEATADAPTTGGAETPAFAPDSIGPGPVAADSEPALGESAGAESAAGEAAGVDTGRRTRSSRSTNRSTGTRRTRRPSTATTGESNGAAEAPASEASATEGAGDAARAPRRRRTRRPAGATADGGGESVSGEAGA
jgi:hypothetical protein